MRRRLRARRGAALLLALAALVLLGALAVSVSAVAWRARRAAARATLSRRATDAVDSALAEWELRLARDASPLVGDPVGAERALDAVDRDAIHVRVRVAALAGGARFLVAESEAGAPGIAGADARPWARRRAGVLLVPDSIPAVLPDSGVARPVLRRAPGRAWIALP